MMLTDVIDAYLAKQRSLGMRFESAGHLLRRFCRAMGDPKIDDVTPEAVAEFLQGRGALSATWMLSYRCYGAGDEGVAPWLLSRQSIERPVKRNDSSRSLAADAHDCIMIMV